jgi:uroporphyrinogen-III synthase
MRLIVTRPRAQALAAVQELRALGIDAVAVPLIDIESLSASADPAAWAALERAGATLATRRLVMFVSANAVSQFFAALRAGGSEAATASAMSWPHDTLAGSTGPGTTAALVSQGVPRANIRAPAADAARLDSEALWHTLRQENRDWAGRSVLIVRGEGGRDWLADTLRDAGARVETITAYRRTAPQRATLAAGEAASLAEAEAEPAAHVWHLSSSEAVQHLPALSPARAWSASPALATHERIGEAARGIGFTRVRVLAPGQEALLHAWREIASAQAS